MPRRMLKLSRLLWLVLIRFAGNRSPWILMRYRFRTLLIATTLMAGGRGLAAWVWRPSFSVDESVVDVGTVRPDTPGKSAFVVHNRGFRSIKLESHWIVGRAYYEPDRLIVPSGESRQCVVHWKSPWQGPESTATEIARIRLNTSDPRRRRIDFVVVERVE